LVRVQGEAIFLSAAAELFPRFREDMVSTIRLPTKPIVALDFEGTGHKVQKGARPYAFALHWPKKTADYGYHLFRQWPVDPVTRKVAVNKKDVKLLQQIVRTHTIVFHNAKYDIRMLDVIGISPEVKNNWSIWQSYHDTQLASHVMDASESHKLKDLGDKYLDIPKTDEADLRKRTISIRNNEANHHNWLKGEMVEPESRDHIAMDYWMAAALHALGEGEKGDDTLLAEYNVMDVRRTILLWLMYADLLEENNLWNPYLREIRLQRTVYRQEGHGVTLVKRKLDAELKRYSIEAQKYLHQCLEIASDKCNWAEINLNSSKQLQRILFTDPTKRTSKHKPDQTYGFGLEPTKVTSGDEEKGYNFSTDKWEMPKFLDQAEEDGNKPAVEFLSNLLHYRKNEKASGDLSGYKGKLVPYIRANGSKTDWKLHPSLLQTGTATTRFSHQDPNTANVSKGDQLDKDEAVDFTLREVFGPTWGRIWYAFDYNQLQLRIFAKLAGEERFMQALREGYDAHTWVATQIFECSPEEVDKFRRRIAKNVNFGFIFGAGESKIDKTSGIKGLRKRINDLFPKAHDYMRKTISEVRRNGYITTAGGYRLPVAPSFAYAGVCYQVQGAEGDIVKNAMLTVDKYLEDETNDEAYLTLQVHDELVFDFPRDGNQHEARDSYLPKKHKLILGEIARLMIKAGADLGFETPVACERIRKDWANGVKQPLGEIYVRRYRRTGMHAGQYQAYGGGKNYKGRNNKKRLRVHQV
jgi:DNA polymerase I-like protein with 3'-5' exonuclease and polymerase domains